MLFFWILLAFNTLVALIFFYFFLIGLADGSVTSFNMGLWLLILAVLAGVLIGGLLLQKHHYHVAANLVLLIVAIPGLLYGLMLLSMLGIKDWR